LKDQYSDLRAVEMIKEAGHMVQMERAEEVNALILKFLGTLRP
jgi:pimeloyl-ACP methyl ester carboxylesterase